MSWYLSPIRRLCTSSAACTCTWSYTRRELADGLPVLLSRIDLIYAKVPPSDLGELRVLVRTLGIDLFLRRLLVRSLVDLIRLKAFLTTWRSWRLPPVSWRSEKQCFPIMEVDPLVSRVVSRACRVCRQRESA